MMKKIILIILAISIFLLVGCGNVKVINSENNDTVRVAISSPYYVTNQGSFEAIINDGKGKEIFLPIKSFSVVQNIGSLKVELIKPNHNDELESESTVSKSFKFNDREKYSALKITMSNQPFININNKLHFVSPGYVFIEMELYESEIIPEDIDKFRDVCLSNNSIDYLMIDPYFGHFLTFTQPLESTIKPEEYETKISETLDSFFSNCYDNYTKNDKEFIKIADEIRNTFRSENSYDKALAIYNWIVDNIKYNINSVNFDYNTGIYNTDSCSVLNALKKRETICYGYSYLFHALARYHDVESYTIIGIGGSDTKLPHAWNIVILDDESIIYIDTTFGATDPLENRDKHFVKSPNDEFSNIHLVWDGEKYVSFKPNIL